MTDLEPRRCRYAKCNALLIADGKGREYCNIVCCRAANRGARFLPVGHPAEVRASGLRHVAHRLGLALLRKPPSGG